MEMGAMGSRKKRKLREIVTSDARLLWAYVQDFARYLTVANIISVSFALALVLSILGPVYLAFLLWTMRFDVYVWLPILFLAPFAAYLWACWLRTESSDRFFEWLERLHKGE